MTQDQFKKLPDRVQEALTERECDIASITSPEKIMREYATWHIGDPAWGSDFYDIYKESAKVLGETA